jgi:hypothetical protein
MLAFTATVLAFHLISRAFLPEFEARKPGQHRNEHRTGTAPCPDHPDTALLFGSQQCRGTDRMLPTVDYALYNRSLLQMSWIGIGRLQPYKV